MRIALILFAFPALAAPPVHVWEKQELTFTAARSPRPPVYRRHDASQAWKKYYAWPDSYARFVEYIFARYQANNVLLSPIHFDTASESIPATDFMPAIDMALRQRGAPPFGTLLTANPAPSTLLNWGDGS